MIENSHMQKKHFILLIVIFINTSFLKAQIKDVNSIFKTFSENYAKGDFYKAEENLMQVIQLSDSLPNNYKIAIYNNLGVINSRLGRYETALGNFNQAEGIVNDNEEEKLSLADIYVNKARIYGILKESARAILYLEQAIKIYTNRVSFNKEEFFKLSTAYLNLGVTYLELSNFNLALKYLEKSKSIKIDYNLSGKGLVFQNLAKTYSRVNKVKEAQDYFIKCILCFKDENGEFYYRLAEVYFDYGKFLRDIGRLNESFEIHQKALEICLKNYGLKHTLVSLAYKHLGDYYFYYKDYPNALEYYQKSLIAVVVDFNNSNIDANPSLSSVLFDIRLLENLKSKAKALEAYSEQQVDNTQKGHYLKKSFETIELGLELIARIRRGYITPESKFYLAQNEKETYFFAVQLAQKLFESNKDNSFKEKMYSIACLSKAAVLRNEIAESDALTKFESGDSLVIKYRKLLIDIASFSKLVDDESDKSNPDKNKVDFWKTSLFELNRKKEKMYHNINVTYPNYQLSKGEPLALKEIQNRLEKDETIIEYLISNSLKSPGRNALYLFTISKNRLSYYTTLPDSSFIHKMKVVKEGTSFNSNVINSEYADALFVMYENLIKPIESDLVGKKIIIIPDEEIAYLPFDSFIKKKPNSNEISFDELPYLIYDYTISYGYTSSLLAGPDFKGSPSVVAFQPEYSMDKGRHADLLGANREILEISKIFKTERISANEATESKFMSKKDDSAILHLAMHSSIDKNNSKYSYLVFDSINDNHNDGRLYNYEISNIRINSPMVVLSACNTGDGSLIEGEGIMSLARGFFLAGVPSIICTYWDVNDNASEKIMERFYYHLSKGDEKSEALRKAKLEYLSETPPAYSKPSYWAAYEVLGDNSPVKRSPMHWLYLLLGFSIVSLVALTHYFRRSKRS